MFCSTEFLLSFNRKREIIALYSEYYLLACCSGRGPPTPHQLCAVVMLTGTTVMCCCNFFVNQHKIYCTHTDIIRIFTFLLLTCLLTLRYSGRSDYCRFLHIYVVVFSRNLRFCHPSAVNVPKQQKQIYFHLILLCIYISAESSFIELEL